MESFQGLIDLFLHLDQFLSTFVQAHGSWVYALLFLVIFAETGLVVTPFLPGDSLLFVAGTLAGAAAMDVWLLTPMLIVAAILGDNTNYWIGRFFGKKLSLSRVVKPEHLEKLSFFIRGMGARR